MGNPHGSGSDPTPELLAGTCRYPGVLAGTTYSITPPPALLIHRLDLRLLLQVLLSVIFVKDLALHGRGVRKGNVDTQRALVIVHANFPDLLQEASSSTSHMTSIYNAKPRWTSIMHQSQGLLLLLLLSSSRCRRLTVVVSLSSRHRRLAVITTALSSEEEGGERDQLATAVIIVVVTAQ